MFGFGVLATFIFRREAILSPIIHSLIYSPGSDAQMGFRYLPPSRSGLDAVKLFLTFFKKNGPTPASFSFIFGLFKQSW